MISIELEDLQYPITIEIPENYWESTTTNNENFEFIYNEKELSDIYI